MPRAKHRTASPTPPSTTSPTTSTTAAVDAIAAWIALAPDGGGGPLLDRAQAAYLAEHGDTVETRSDWFHAWHSARRVRLLSEVGPTSSARPR